LVCSPPPPSPGDTGEARQICLGVGGSPPTPENEAPPPGGGGGGGLVRGPHVEKTLSDIHDRLNYNEIITDRTQFTHVAAGSVLETHEGKGKGHPRTGHEGPKGE